MAYPVRVILSTVESWWSIQGKKRFCEGNSVMDRMPVNFREVLVCNTPSALGRYDTFHTTWCDELVNLSKYDLNNMNLSHVEKL